MSSVKAPEKLKKLQIDLTPLIDVVFMLLVFFMLCTRFATDERNHRAELPLDEGLATSKSIPKEQVTIYCNWETDSMTNEYIIAIGARNRKLVQGTRTRLKDMIVYANDDAPTLIAKRELYSKVFEALVGAVEAYIPATGAKIEKLEISFAIDAQKGAAGGTAPWMFVSLAIDAAGRVNTNREKRGQPQLSVTFKFADALGKFRQQ